MAENPSGSHWIAEHVPAQAVAGRHSLTFMHCVSDACKAVESFDRASSLPAWLLAREGMDLCAGHN